MANNTEIYEFNVLFVKEIYTINVPRQDVNAIYSIYAALRDQVPDAQKHLKNKSYLTCKYYKLTPPVLCEVDQDTEEVCYGAKWEALPLKSPYQRIETNCNFSRNGVYVVVVPPQEKKLMMLHKMERTDKQLYRLLIVSVSDAGKWKRQDVIKNGGNFVKKVPKDILKIEESLNKKRFYKVSQSENDDWKLTQRDGLKQLFSLWYDDEDSADPSSFNANEKEFVALFNAFRCFGEDVEIYKNAKSSAVKGSPFKVYFMHPVFLSNPGNTSLLYREEVAWAFPLLLTTNAPSPTAKTRPKSDCDVMGKDCRCPLLLCEIVSNRQHNDRERLLLRAVTIARVGSVLIRKSSEFFVVAVYLTEKMVAERYILAPKINNNTKIKRETKVNIVQKDFDLKKGEDRMNFFVELYNLVPRLQTIALDLSPTKFNLLTTIGEFATVLDSIASSKNKKSDLGTAPMPTILEEGDPDADPRNDQGSGQGRKESSRGSGHESDQQGGNEDDNNSGQSDDSEESDNEGLYDDVFESDEVRTILAGIDYQVELVDFGYRNVASVYRRDDFNLIGFLKFVKAGGIELQILQYLASIEHAHNHTIRLIQVWDVTEGSLVYTPNAGSPLLSLYHPDEHLWNVAKQLFEAVEFMHAHGVAHLDLKPRNILIPREGGTLTIIDFNASVRVRHANHMFRGYVGTEGYVAPEIGKEAYSPIRADLWSCGKVVMELCELCEPSPNREWLENISHRLMVSTPTKRPMMESVIRWMMKAKHRAVQESDIPQQAKQPQLETVGA